MNDLIMPSADDTERSVLGSCLVLGRRVVGDAMNAGLAGDDFYSGKHRTIWECVCEVWDAGTDRV